MNPLHFPYLYIGYAVLSALFILFECHSRKKPKIWSAVVLFIPVLAPYYISQSRRKPGKALIIILMVSFFAILGAEVYLFKDYKEKNKYAHLPTAIRDMIRFNEQVINSSAELEHELRFLGDLSRVLTRFDSLEKTIGRLDEIRVKVEANQRDINRLTGYLREHDAYFVSQNLAWLFVITIYYNNPDVIKANSQRLNYLNAVENLLSYTYENFENITEKHSQTHVKNYDAYYGIYMRALESFIKYNTKRIEYQEALVAENPKIGPYLKGERETQAFEYWERL